MAAASTEGKMTMHPPLELEHWQLVDAMQDYCESYIPGYARMTYNERRSEAKRQLDLFVMRRLTPPPSRPQTIEKGMK